MFITTEMHKKTLKQHFNHEHLYHVVEYYPEEAQTALKAMR